MNFHLETVKRQTKPTCVKGKEEVLVSLPIKPQIWITSRDSLDSAVSVKVKLAEECRCCQGEGLKLQGTSVGQNGWKQFAVFICVLFDKQACS